MNLHLSSNYSEKKMDTDLVTIVESDPFLSKVVTTSTYAEKTTHTSPNRSRQEQSQKVLVNWMLISNYSTLHVFLECIFQLSLIRKKLLTLSGMAWQHEPNCCTQGQLESPLKKCAPDPYIITNKYITVETGTTV